jgi:16S rRNA (cytosine967-C5)-methyltransferase
MPRAEGGTRTRWAPGAAALAEAARAVCAVVFEGRSADQAVAASDGTPQRAAVRAIALGTIRWYLRLAPALDGLITRPRTVAHALRALLVTGAHQIEYSRNAPQATVHAAVDAARILRQPAAAGLVNAVLRRFAAERAALFERVDRELPARTAHPAWLVEELQQAWGARTAEILEANNQHPPMVLRVDQSRISVAGYLQELQAADIPAREIPWCVTALQLERPVAVAALPGFHTGLVSVQDAGAQLAPTLLDARAGMRILDACAAPGGKAGHLLEHSSDVELVAVDVDADRLGLVRGNLQRLGRSARLFAADIREPRSFWDGRPFERILLDAPCSSTGVIRRHPDIKLLRRREDIVAFATLQLQALQATFGMLAPGGRLLYCTCSVLPSENDLVVRQFLEREPAARAAALAVQWIPGALPRDPGVQLLPGAEAGTDGFYYACLEKTTTGT